MTCKFCGNEINEGADVCFICGQPVEKEQAAAPETAVPAEAVYVEPQPAQPVYEPIEQPAPVEQVEPVAQMNFEPAAPVEVPKGKKNKVKNPNKVGGFLLFICALLPFVGGFVYLKNKNKPERKVQIANATFIGLDIWLFLIIVYCFKKNFLS